MLKRNSGNIPAFAWPCFLVLAIIAILLLSAPEPVREVEAPLPPQLYSSAYQLIGTGNRLGTYFPVGNILADWFNSHFDAEGGVFKAVETNGSVDNVRLLREGRIMLGMVESRIACETWAADASSSIRIVWPLWEDVVHLVKTHKVLNHHVNFRAACAAFLARKIHLLFERQKRFFLHSGLVMISAASICRLMPF